MVTNSPARSSLDPRAAFPPRVLVVDDEPLIRWSICAALTADGIDAVAAATLADVERLTAEQPALRVALLDRRFSGASERLLMASVLASAPGCRFLLMTTASGGPVDGSGGAGIIEKPFDLQRIVARVHALLSAAEAGKPAIAPDCA